MARSSWWPVFRRHFSQELACSDVARALVPTGVPPGPGTLADASFDTVSQPRTRVEMRLRTPDVVEPGVSSPSTRHWCDNRLPGVSGNQRCPPCVYILLNERRCDMLRRLIRGCFPLPRPSQLDAARSGSDHFPWPPGVPGRHQEFGDSTRQAECLRHIGWRSVRRSG
jgi:hypothetical protein